MVQPHHQTSLGQSTSADGQSTAPEVKTLGELRASGHEFRSVKDEVRQNLLARLRDGKDPFPGILGFDETVRPHLERALIAGHDVILLGERGQGKTRLIRTLTGLLDEWSPVVTGCEINDHPFAPVCVRCRRLAAELGDELPVSWHGRDDRYGEKLATPDTSVGDLIGDIDPVKVAEGRTLGDPETIHYGLVPRTNRGRIITPLKDRFGAEIRTHYPLSLDDELAVVEQEAEIAWGGDNPDAVLPRHLIEVIARFTRLVRSSPAVDARSGVSARFGIAAAEAVVAAAVRRAAISGEEQPVARICDLPTVVSTLRGKVEFEVSEEGREAEVLEHLLRRATADTFRAHLGSADLSGLVTRFAEGGSVESSDLLPAAELLRRIGEVPGLAKIMERLDGDGGESFGQAAAALEFALEGLYLMRRLSKDVVDGGAIYRG